MPKREAVKKTLDEIRKRGVSYEYFFDRLNSPDWIKPLFDEGMFQHPQEPKREGTSVTFPFWPESRYLARMAALAPETVLEIILQIPETENIRVHQDLADAALAMPPDLAAALVPKTKTWIKSPYQLLLAEKLGELMANLARGGQVEATLELARSLLDVLPDPRAEDDTRRHFLEPRAHFDIWHYEQIMNKHVPELVAVAGERALMMFCDLLEKAIRLSFRDKEGDDGEDHSSSWRPAIEEHNQNRYRPELMGLLVSAVRDTSESMMETNGKAILRVIEARPFKVFQRIGLHLRRKWPEADPEGTARLVKDPAIFDDFDLHYELFQLLKEQFGKLSTEAQQRYLTLVEQGFDVKTWLDFKERQSGERPSQEEADLKIRYWQYRKLYPIQAFLADEWRRQFDMLKEEFGENPHPDFHSYISSVWVGPTSPKSTEELRSMDVEELMAFLKAWQPSGDWMSPSPEGLGRNLAALVSSDPYCFATKASQFEVLDLTYVRALITGLHEARKQHKSFLWPPVLDLCLWVIDQTGDIPERKSDDDVDTSWISTRRAIADLLSKGFESDDGGIPFDLRDTVWRIIKPLTDDPEPTLEYEARYGGSNMSPAMLSINTTRGQAMHAVVHYALWIRRHIHEEAHGEDRVSRGFDEMPEVREVLDYHLNPEHDRALAIRAVYGELFPWLVLLDRDWAIDNVHKIFPMESSFLDLRDAAWESYVIFCHPSGNVFDVLREEYRRAVERIGMDSGEEHLLAKRDERLAEHLMAFYWQGKLNLEEQHGLLAQFYVKASTSLLGHALQFIGYVLHNTKETTAPEILDRLKTLLIERIKAVHSASSPASQELIPFGWWFASAQFEDVWAITQLKEVLKIAGKAEPDHMVVERLATLAPTIPLLTVECLSLIIQGDKEGWGIYSWREHARSILSTAIKSTDTKAQQAAEDIVNYLGAHRFLEFRDLLSKR